MSILESTHSGGRSLDSDRYVEEITNSLLNMEKGGSEGVNGKEEREERERVCVCVCIYERENTSGKMN